MNKKTPQKGIHGYLHVNVLSDSGETGPSVCEIQKYGEGCSSSEKYGRKVKIILL